MAPVIMDGKKLAQQIKDEVRQRVEAMSSRPGLAMVIVGDDPAGQVYESGKKKDCQQCGIYCDTFRLPREISREELAGLIEFLNRRDNIDGILVQFPLPEHLSARAVQLAIRPDKEVDCVNPVNMGDLMLGVDTFRPCTPAGVMRLLEEYGVDPAGKRCVMVGRSNIVGKPQAMLMLLGNATGDMVKEGAVVVDIAINRDARGRLRGDVDFDQVARKASYITPVPGGVGPVTRAMLLENTLKAALRHGKT